MYISKCSDVNIGGLSKEFTNKVYVTDTQSVNLVVDPDVNKPNLQKNYGIWDLVNIDGYGNGTTRFTGVRTNGEHFTIDVVGADTLSIHPGLTKFEVGSTLSIDCAESKTVTKLDMNWPYSNEIQMRSTLNVSSDKCTALINNMISTNTNVTPTVVLGNGLALDLSLTMLPPYVPEANAVTSNATTRPLRSLKINTESTTNRSSYLLSESLPKTNKTIALVNIQWDSLLTKDISHNLQDTAYYVLDFDANAINDGFVHMNVSSSAELSFGDLHESTVLFTSAKTTDFTPVKRKFSLTPSNSSGDYCFDPCQDCTEGAWGRVVISGKICQPRSAQDSCKERAKVVVNITGTLEGVSCGFASFDDGRNATCPFAMNFNEGKDNGVLTVPQPVMVGTTVIIAFSIILTIIGASSLIARIVFSCKNYSTINIWWTHNSFRDLLTDQFSWAAIVITACLPEVVDVDYAQWGGWVVAIMMRAKTFVLNWFVTCSDDGEPVWVTPATIVFWIVTLITVILRIIELVLKKREVTLSSPVKNTGLAIQSVLTVTGFLLMPLVGYSLAFLNSTSYAGFASVLCVVLLFFSQPVGNFSRSCISGIVASVLNVLIPVALCIYVGVGAKFLPLAIIALCCAVILPVINIIILWLSFFRKAVLHNFAWKNSLAWTISLRVASMLCGIAFLAMLFFDLSSSEKMTKIAAGLWFGWVCIPFLCVIPLTFGVPAVLSASEVVATRKHTLPSANDEANSLLGNMDQDETDQL